MGGGENQVKLNKVDLNELQERNVEKSENVDEDLEQMNKENCQNNYNFYNASAKLLNIQNSRVNMFVPGAGVKNFYFSQIFGGADLQDDV